MLRDVCLAIFTLNLLIDHRYKATTTLPYHDRGNDSIGSFVGTNEKDLQRAQTNEKRNTTHFKFRPFTWLWVLLIDTSRYTICTHQEHRFILETKLLAEKILQKNTSNLIRNCLSVCPVSIYENTYILFRDVEHCGINSTPGISTTQFRGLNNHSK
jgi:hypothetical protein